MNIEYRQPRLETKAASKGFKASTHTEGVYVYMYT